MNVFRFLGIVVLMMFFSNVKAQSITLKKLTGLGSEVAETSGLLNLEGRIFTNNDSGNRAELYEIDTISGVVKRKLVVKNLANIDWEEISADEQYVYIGDFGNNKGDRKNLRIYRISREQILNSDSVSADTITFSYSDQTSYTPKLYTTNFDAEAFILIGDNIYIFSKNWGNFRTNVYKLPASPGNHKALKIDSLEVNGLVTCAYYSPDVNKVILAGYTFTEAFICKVFFYSDRFSLQQRFPIQESAGVQIEGICQEGSNAYFLTNETSTAAAASLFSASIPEEVTRVNSGQTKKKIIITNPAKDLLRLNEIIDMTLMVVDNTGKIVYEGQDNQVEVSGWVKGLYTVIFMDRDHKLIDAEKLVVE